MLHSHLASWAASSRGKETWEARQPAFNKMRCLCVRAIILKQRQFIRNKCCTVAESLHSLVSMNKMKSLSFTGHVWGRQDLGFSRSNFLLGLENSFQNITPGKTSVPKHLCHLVDAVLPFYLCTWLIDLGLSARMSSWHSHFNTVSAFMCSEIVNII